MKVCEMCGAQNDDVFTKCSVCGADLPSMNSQDGDDEKTVLIDPDQAPAQPSGLSLKTDTSTYGQADAGQQLSEISEELSGRFHRSQRYGYQLG